MTLNLANTCTDLAAGSLSVAKNGVLGVPHLELVPRRDKRLLLEHMQTKQDSPTSVFAAYEPRKPLPSLDKGMLSALEVFAEGREFALIASPDQHRQSKPTPPTWR